MKANVYVVKLGGKLYIQSEFYSIYPATTKDILSAKFFRDPIKAEKMAKKAKGEVVELFLTDEEVLLDENLKEERDRAIKEASILKSTLQEILNKAK